jgi:hypothetical protein
MSDQLSRHAMPDPLEILASWATMSYVMDMAALNVQAHWDEAAGVWWADSDDIPGLVTEADTFPDLVQHVRSLAPLVIRENLGREPHGAVVHITDGQHAEEFVTV